MDEIYKMDEIMSFVIGWLDRWHILEYRIQKQCPF